jgi:predicted methyltransferase
VSASKEWFGKTQITWSLPSQMPKDVKERYDAATRDPQKTVEESKKLMKTFFKDTSKLVRMPKRMAKCEDA